MNKIIIYSFIMLTSLFSLAAHEISKEDQVVLEKLFKFIFTHSECGYVLYDHKPICEHGYYEEDQPFAYPGIFTHEINVILKEGMRVWSKLNYPNRGEYIFQAYNKRNPLDENIVEFFFIHKKALLTSIQNNITLFQYVLGPEVTSIKLAEKLIDPSQSPYAVLKQDNVLTGIVLGFGTQNSLYHSRQEILQKKFREPESPPLRPVSENFISINNDMEKALFPKKKRFYFDKVSLLFNDYTPPSSNTEQLTPSFGFPSISDEINFLSNKIGIASEPLIHEDPNFLFGCLRGNLETELLIKNLEITQKKIQQLLKSESFLSQVLQAITGQDIPLHKIDASHSIFLSMTAEEKSYFPRIIADYILKAIKEEKTFFVAYFTGMKDAENNVPLEQYDKAYLSNLFFEYEVSKKLKKAKVNFQISNEVFQDLSKNQTYSNIVPKKLYYKVLEDGRGAPIICNNSVQLHYSITSGPNNTLLCDTRFSGRPQQLSLTDCITGIQLGVSGMRLGEVRELFIHPDLAYGLYTTLEKAQYLKATVQLVNSETAEANDKQLNFLKIDVENEIPADLEINYLDQQKQVAYIRGYNTWNFYKKMNNLYSLDQIIEWMKKLQSEDLDLPQTMNANAIINRLHWNLFQMQSNSD